MSNPPLSDSPLSADTADTRPSRTLAEHLGMDFVEVTPEHMVVRMPITANVMQPSGVLHGGATVALAETVASIGTYVGIDTAKFYCVGLEINCNHLHSVRAGSVTAEGTPIHRGRTTWVWDIRMRDDAGRLTAIARCTIAVVPITKDLPSS